MSQQIVVIEPSSQYGVTNHFAHELAEALTRQGAGVKCLPANIDQLSEESPDLFVSLNLLAPLEDGQLFCDTVQIPHLTILVDIAYYALGFFQSSYTILSCVDNSFCRFVKSQGEERTFHLPMATKALEPHPEKDYGVVSFATCLDYIGIQEQWEGRFTPATQRKMVAIAEEVMESTTLNTWDAILESFGSEENPVTLHQEVELYLKGRSRVETLRAIKTLPVDLFGASTGARGWDHYLSDQENIRVHPPITYQDTLEILRRSQLLLNSTPFFKEGAHERIFNGMAAGAIVVTNDCPYLREQFTAEEEVVLYTGLDLLEEQVNVALSNKTTGPAGRKAALASHTWDQRAETLLEALPLMASSTGNRV